MNSVIFDIGATKMRIAYYEGGSNFESPEVVFTPKNYGEGINLFFDTAKKVSKGRAINNFSGGMSRNIQGWVYEKFVNDVEGEFNTKVFFQNDAAMVGLGEANFGAGKDFDIVAYITVSTGVGGARFIKGKMDEFAIGFEPGKQIIDIENGKTLEDLISGRALRERTGQDPKSITDADVWDEHARILAVGLNNIIVEWSPNCVVLGGSMITGNPAIPLPQTLEYLKGILKIYEEIPPIKMAELGDFGGLWGALSYLKQQIES